MEIGARLGSLAASDFSKKRLGLRRVLPREQAGETSAHRLDGRRPSERFSKVSTKFVAWCRGPVSRSRTPFKDNAFGFIEGESAGGRPTAVQAKEYPYRYQWTQPARLLKKPAQTAEMSHSASSDHLAVLLYSTIAQYSR